MQACSYEPVAYDSGDRDPIENNTISIKASRHLPDFEIIDPLKNYKAEGWHLPLILAYIGVCIGIKAVLMIICFVAMFSKYLATQAFAAIAFILLGVIMYVSAKAFHEFLRIDEKKTDERVQLHLDYDSVFKNEDPNKTDTETTSARLVSLVPTLVVETDDDGEDVYTTDDSLRQSHLWIAGELQQREREEDGVDPESYQVFVPTDTTDTADPTPPPVIAMVSSVIDGAVIVTADDLTRYSMELPDGAKLLYDGETLSVGSPAGSSRAVKRLYAHVVVDRDLYKWNGPDNPTDQMPLGRITVSHNDETHALFSYSTCAATAGAAE